MSKRAILILDGEEPNAVLVRRILDEESAAMIVATDGAAKYAMRHAIRLDAIVGDMDSLTQDAADFYDAQGTQIISMPEQYSNDFEKALRFIASTGDEVRLTVFGIHGRRTDHVFTNFSVMQRFTDDFEELVAYDETLIHRFLTTKRNAISLNLAMNTIVSLTPLPQAEGVTTRGLLYPLEDATMVFGERDGLSNRVSSEIGGAVAIRSGALLVSHMF